MKVLLSFPALRALAQKSLGRKPASQVPVTWWSRGSERSSPMWQSPTLCCLCHLGCLYTLDFLFYSRRRKFSFLSPVGRCWLWLMVPSGHGWSAPGVVRMLKTLLRNVYLTAVCVRLEGSPGVCSSGPCIICSTLFFPVQQTPWLGVNMDPRGPPALAVLCVGNHGLCSLGATWEA